jgi:Baseplate J-like protein
MPIQLPNLDNRRYQQLVDEALARIPVHTPEWTNFNQSDPGVTLVQVFAFLTETLIYRCNQIPNRNRLKFLQLLGVPLLPAASATGLVTFANERGPLKTITLNDDLEVRAGQVPFRTDRGLDVLPIEAQVYFKMVRIAPPAEQKEARAAYDSDFAHYQQLYEALLDEQAPADLQLYEPVNLATRGASGVDIGSETVDQTLWIALLLRSNDNPPSDLLLTQTRQAIGGKTLSLGLVPQIDAADVQRRLPPGGNTATTASLQIQLPNIPANGSLPANRQPSYRLLSTEPVPDEPVVIDINLPDASQLTLWNNLDPLEPGTNDLPPPLDDTALNNRIITWLRLNWGPGTHARVQSAGINAATITQRARVSNEVLTLGATGEPDQIFTLANAHVLPDSIVLTVAPAGQAQEAWNTIEDLLSAGPEVPTTDPRYPPGVIPGPPQPAKVFTVDGESGTIRFGDGFRGARPPLSAVIRVDYDYSQGSAGNVGVSAISSAPALPTGLIVANPVGTWGGTDSETVDQGEKQVARFLQHRDRLVNAADFEAIALRTPGVQIGRVDVLAAYNPLLSQHEPGNAPGAVTLMLIPRFDALRPDAPQPDDRFIQAVCDYLDPRRLVTTELFLQGPDYQPIFISVGISIVSGRNFSAAVVRQGVIDRLKQFLAPLNPDSIGQLGDPTALLTTPSDAANTNGWPLGRAVLKGELEVEVARVPGVSSVNELLLASTTGDDFDQIAMQGLQLPRVDGIQVSVGDAVPISSVRGDSQDGPPAARRLVPVPAIPDEC